MSKNTKYFSEVCSVKSILKYIRFNVKNILNNTPGVDSVDDAKDIYYYNKIKYLLTDNYVKNIIIEVIKKNENYINYDVPEINIINYIIKKTINIIVNTMKNQNKLKKLENYTSSNFSVWNSLLGDQNRQGLRSYSTIKTRKKTLNLNI